MSAMMGGTPASHAEAAAEPAPAKAAAAPPAAPPAPVLAPKAAGTVRVGIVKIKDMSGQSLPTDNLRLNLMSEIGRHQMEAVPLDAEAPQTDVESEASAKQCDYILYTVSAQVKEPDNGGLPAASLPKGVTLDPTKFQALTDVTLYKVGKPAPRAQGPCTGGRCHPVRRQCGDGDVRHGVRQSRPAGGGRCPSQARREAGQGASEAGNKQQQTTLGARVGERPGGRARIQPLTQKQIKNWAL